ncbi:MAG: endolytic transglycosylase MltG, partial [Prevotellaceae bacterium]|nr:endolytic transglycosylase MltG [Prevotellaceae bacterium]
MLGALAVGIAAGALYYLYSERYRANVSVPEEGLLVYIPTGATRAEALYSVIRSGGIKNSASFIRTANGMKYGYKRKIYAGCYKILPDMNNRQLVRMLTAGTQTPVNLTFHSTRTRQRLAGVIAQQIEPDSAALLQAITDEALADSFGFTVETFSAMFIPNTYQLYWNISVGDFLKRMHREWNAFWSSGDREQKREQLGLSRVEVVILASIVSEETLKVDEMPTIAGVYINRLRKNMALQADPTVRYAMGNVAMRRVLKSYTQVRSPYNTYQRQGLPPGPICIPSPTTIDAVLNYEKHSYMFFCAKADFSGYHTFSKTFTQ